jgi:flagellar protein FliO/FliZ
MFKWLRDRNASQRVGVIESVQLDGKRSIKLVRRDNIEHLVLTGGRNDVVIEPNIVRQPAPKQYLSVSQPRFARMRNKTPIGFSENNI